MVTQSNEYEEGRRNQKQTIKKIKVLFKIGIPEQEDDEDESESDESVSQFEADL